MSDLAAAIDAWCDAAKHYIDAWTSDPTVSAAYATWIGTLTNLWMGSPSTRTGPNPTTGAVNPKQTPGTTTVVITPTTGTAFRPTAWLDGARNYIPDSLVTLIPSSGKAGVSQPVLVQVMPPIGIPAGKYAGSIVDDGGAILADAVEVDISPV